ncbi:MAG TPA: MrpF/PhaF family protein [Acidobacteriaceae bacterium]|jgi:multisubunit Na+/H+ antiporter MnhF subunit|nr:MrpF/PhaF family protein [Acidobacteriaceae bacterium]
MNRWILTALATSGCLVPCAWACLRGSAERRLVGLEMTGIIVTLLMVLLSVGEGRLIFFDLPLTLSVLAFGAGLVFARFLEKHL